MINCFKKYFDAYFAYFAAKPHQILKTKFQFENLVFVIITTRKNTRLIARASLLLIITFYYKYIQCVEIIYNFGDKTFLYLIFNHIFGFAGV